MRPDAMVLEVSLGCSTFGFADPIELEGGHSVPGEPNVVRISGRFGEIDPLSIEDATIVLPKLAYLFEALVKEHNARKESELQRLAFMQQAAAHQAEQVEAAAQDQAATEDLATDQEVTDAE